jgi:primosomal protein N'
MRAESHHQAHASPMVTESTLDSNIRMMIGPKDWTALDVTLPVFKVFVKEPGDGEATTPKTARDMSIRDKLAQILHDFPDRTFSIDYCDKDTGWSQFDEEVKVLHFKDVPEVRIVFTALLSKFHYSQFEKTLLHKDRRALRIPQHEALGKLREQLFDRQQNEFWVCMPTGSGKTLVLSLAPFMLNIERVLVLTPGVQIANQDFENLAATYTKHFKGAPTFILHQCVVLPPCIRFPVIPQCMLVDHALPCHSLPRD